jgi:histone H3/H4
MAKETKKIEIPTMVVQSKVKEFAKTIDPDIRMSGEFLAELNEQLAQIVNNSVRRCHENNRKTLKPSDL